MSDKRAILPIKKLIKAGGLPGYLLLSYNLVLFVVTRKRDLQESANVDASAFIQIFYILIIFGLLFHYFILGGPQNKKYLFSRPNWFLLAYSVICFLSAIWSPQFSLSFYRAFEALTFLGLISWTVQNLSKNLDIQNLVEWLVLWSIWVTFWEGATRIRVFFFAFLQEPFNVGRLDYPAVLFFALLLSKRKWCRYILLVLAIFSFSNKIYLGFALGLVGFLFGDSKQIKITASFGIIILTSTLIFIDPETLLKNTIFIGREEISIEDSSGRNLIWETAWQGFKDSPFIGYGFVSGETTLLYDKFKGAINTHNFLFSGLLGTGIFGSIFLLLYFTHSLKKSFSQYWPKNKWRSSAIATVLMCITLSSLSPGVGGRVYGSWISVVLTITILMAIFNKFKTQNK